MNNPELIESYFDRLWPINRSLTGEGVQKSLDIITELIPGLERLEIPSGTQVFDWNVPSEWNIREAWIKGPDGKKIVDFADNNLHVLGYSEPFHGILTREQLIPHLYSLPEYPDWVPYVTSYYKRRWGFCMTQNQKNNLPEGEYEVMIDSDLNEDGTMTMAHAILPGETDSEILISTYICHPSMANNELSGPLVSSFLYQLLSKLPNRKYTYRFVFVPETIGSLTYLSLYGDHLKEKLIGGLVLTCIGDDNPFNYKQSKRGNTLIDRAAEAYLLAKYPTANIRKFWPLGSDERQYCSPGFDLPVGSLIRSVYGEYKEYHTSADNKDYISFTALAESINTCFGILSLVEANDYFVRTEPHGEPQLGKHGLYPTVGGPKSIESRVAALLWLLNYADGKHDVIDTLSASRCNPTDILEGLQSLLATNIIRPKLVNILQMA